jgi:GntR family transcriptional regulator
MAITSGRREEQDHRPLYRRLADDLRAEIAALRPGDRIASEPELVKRAGVSRATVAKAIEALVEEQLLVRRQGKGTFVTVPPLHRAPGRLRSFSESVSASGHRTSSELLAFGPAQWSAGLPFAPDEKLVGLDRLRRADDVPIALHYSVIAAALAAEVGLTRGLVAEHAFSLYRHFERAGLRIDHGFERLHARLPDAKERQLLDLDKTDVVVEVQRLSYDADGRLLEFVNAVHNSRRYSYEALLLRNPGAGAPRVPSVQEDDHGDDANYPEHYGPRYGRGAWSRGHDRASG